MTVLETILYFVVPSVGLYLLIALLVAAPRLARRPRYRVGQPWPYPPLWWTANPEGAPLPPTDDSHALTAARSSSGARIRAERGGARGSW